MLIGRDGVFGVVVTTWVYGEVELVEKLGAVGWKIAFGDLEDVYLWQEIVGLLLDCENGLEGKLSSCILMGDILNI